MIEISETVTNDFKTFFFHIATVHFTKEKKWNVTDNILNTVNRLNHSFQ